MILPEPVRVAVVGYGYWGPNLVRNVSERRELSLEALVERDEMQCRAFSARYPGVPVHRDFEAVLDDDSIEAVLIATPPRSHHELVKAALIAGKHVLVEKPMAKTALEAQDLVAAAQFHDRVLMPGHTFIYSPPVNKIRQLINEDVLGEVYFVTSSRMNLGKYQSDGVICDLAPHDISILLYWLNEPIVEVAASSRSVFQADVPETAFITLTFASGTTANLQISWLAPRKVREMVVVGSRRMIQYDDAASDETVRVYDRGIEFTTPETFGEYQLTYRSGDIIVPRLDAVEPLGVELADFARAIRSGVQPQSSAELGLAIVETLEAAEASLAHGRPVRVAAPTAAVA